MDLEKYQKGFSFLIDVPVSNEKAHLIVKAHIDCNQDDQMSRGDFITTAMYSVLTLGNPSSVKINLQKIK